MRLHDSISGAFFSFLQLLFCVAFNSVLLFISTPFFPFVLLPHSPKIEGCCTYCSRKHLSVNFQSLLLAYFGAILLFKFCLSFPFRLGIHSRNCVGCALRCSPSKPRMHWIVAHTVAQLSCSAVRNSPPLLCLSVCSSSLSACSYLIRPVSMVLTWRFAWTASDWPIRWMNFIEDLLRNNLLMSVCLSVCASYDAIYPKNIFMTFSHLSPGHSRSAIRRPTPHTHVYWFRFNFIPLNCNCTSSQIQVQQLQNVLSFSLFRWQRN